MTDQPVPVQTVLGTVDASELGVTLTHEHTLRLPPESSSAGARDFSAALRHEKVTANNAWLVREDPCASLDNRALTDVDELADEIAVFSSAGGRTIVDNSNGPERRPAWAVRVAEVTGVQIVMGSTTSIYSTADGGRAGADPDRLAAALIEEHRDGVPLPDGRWVRPGIIGEIVVGPDFTEDERRDLNAAAIAQTRLGVPLMIHLPGWLRKGHEVLDLVLKTGVDPAAVVLCHMDPSGIDRSYQGEIASRGVWLEFDMIGMLENYPGEGQSPPVNETVNAVAGLVERGFARQLLLSQDVGLKTMWTRNGGNGYGYVQRVFLPRLRAAGVDAEVLRSFLTDNPRALFTQARLSVSGR
jgi:phosphotriesterase-related protein